MTDEMQAVPSEIDPSVESKNALRRVILLFVALAGVTAVIAIIPRLFGANLDPISASMPPETVMYFEIDALNLVSQDSLRIAEAFQEVADQAELDLDLEFEEDQDPQQFLEEFDTILFEETGMTVTDDILPWIGPDFGFGLVDFPLSLFATPDVLGTPDFLEAPELPGMLTAVSVRDRAGADEFIQKLIALGQENDSEPLIESEYSGVTIYTIDTEREDERFSMARANDALILATNSDLIHRAIDAQNGESLANTDLYKKTVAALPENRIVSAFISGAFYTELFESMADDPAFSGMDTSFITDRIFESIGMSISSTKDGIQIDIKSLFDELPEEQLALLEAQTSQIKSPALLPEDTYLLFSGQRMDMQWQQFESVFNSNSDISMADIEESMELFAEQFGFNPITELLPILDGEFTIALTGNGVGYLADQTGLNLGASLIFETSDSDSMLSIVESLNGNLELFLGFAPTAVNHDNAAIFALNDPFAVAEVLAYGVSDDYLMLSSSTNEIEMLLSDKPTLADSEAYISTWDAFPENTIPSMYINIDQLLHLFSDIDPEIDNAARINPVTVFAMGSHYEDDVAGATMIIFIP